MGVFICETVLTVGYAPFFEKICIAFFLLLLIEAGEPANSRTLLHFRRFTRRG
jgi:hypothetical protein